MTRNYVHIIVLGGNEHIKQLTTKHIILTPWTRVLLEKLTSLQLVKKLPAFYGSRRFITALTSARHLSLSWASPIQCIHPQNTSWWSILILTSQLHLGLPSCLFPSCFPTKILYTFLTYSSKLHAASLLSSIILSPQSHLVKSKNDDAPHSTMFSNFHYLVPVFKNP